MANLMFKLRSPYENPQNYVVTFLGTVNGIVLSVVNERNPYDTYATYTRMILYNPFTGAFKLAPDLLCDDLVYCSDHIYGFGHGATVDDLKIVRIDKRAYYENHDTFHVFSFRTNSWSRSRNYNIEDILLEATWGSYPVCGEQEIKGMIASDVIRQRKTKACSKSF
ncbi:hypothetical protein Tco_0730940 [Tanacetum coccineum]